MQRDQGNNDEHASGEDTRRGKPGNGTAGYEGVRVGSSAADS